MSLSVGSPTGMMGQMATGGLPAQPPAPSAGSGAAMTVPPGFTPPGIAKKMDSTTGGGQAIQGADTLGALVGVLQGLVTALTQLVQAISQLAGGSAVKGAAGGAASAGQMINAGSTLADKTSTSPEYGKGRDYSSTKEDHDFENRVVELVNKIRAQHGLKPLAFDAALDRAAEKHADHQARVGKMAHDGIGDGTPGERIRAEGFSNAWGENVATGQLTPEQVVNEWMASPTHRANILKADYNKLSVAYTTAANGRTYWAQEFGA